MQTQYTDRKSYMNNALKKSLASAPTSKELKCGCGKECCAQQQQKNVRKERTKKNTKYDYDG